MDNWIFLLAMGGMFVVLAGFGAAAAGHESEDWPTILLGVFLILAGISSTVSALYCVGTNSKGPWGVVADGVLQSEGGDLTHGRVTVVTHDTRYKNGVWKYTPFTWCYNIRPVYPVEYMTEKEVACDGSVYQVKEVKKIKLYPDDWIRQEIGKKFVTAEIIKNQAVVTVATISY